MYSLSKTIFLLGYVSLLTGCVVYPANVQYRSEHGYVYLAPYYPQPAPGYVWIHGDRGWGWHHPQQGWHDHMRR